MRAYLSGVDIGIHTQNDSGCAVANSIAAVVGGATQVQGTVNGYGERTGNANLMTVIPDLTLKLGIATLPEGRLERLTAVSRHVAELVNVPPLPADPFVGVSAFAHKGGLHTSALGRAGGATYEHVDPDLVGNHTRVLVSDLGGRAGMSMKARELGVELDDRAAGTLSDELKRLESQGWLFEAADALARAAHAPGGGLGPRVLRGRGLPRVELPPRGPGDPGGRGRGHDRGHREAVGRTASASPRSARATVRSTRSTWRCAAALNGRYPALEPHPPHRLQGAGARRRRRPPARWCGC